MEKKYYHDTYFQKIVKLVRENRYVEAINEIQQYLNIYTKDVEGYVLYADILIKINHLEEVECVLNRVENIIEETTPILTYEEFKRVKIFLLCIQKKYQECYLMLRDNISLFYRRKWSFYGLMCFLKRHLNKENCRKHKENSYLINQIFSYDEEKAILHKKRHRHNLNHEVFHFADKFPIENVYYYFRKNLPNEKKYINDEITNSYIFKFINSGHAGNKMVDFIKVITLLDSNDIITMYPYENKERREYIDITPELDEPLKRKRISQIDKFNRRYGNEKNS